MIRYLSQLTRNIRKHGVLLTLLLLLSHLLPAQDALHTLNQFTPLLYQPATPVLDHAATVSFFHDQYDIGSGDYITNNVLNAELPLTNQVNGNRYLGVGLGFVEKDFGQSDLLKTQQFDLAFATSIRIASNQLLAMGLSGSYVNKRTSLERLSTGSQWIQEEFRYDPNANLGEAFVQRRVNYLSLGTGIFWSVSHEDQERFFVSASAFHLNTPGESFFGEYSEVPMTYLLSSGITLVRSRRFEVEPQLYITRSNQKNEYQLVSSVKYTFDNTNPYDLVQPGSLELLVNAGTVPDIGLGLVWHQPNFKLGGSYYIPVGQSVDYYQSRFQIAVGLGLITWKREPQKVVIESHEPRRFDFREQRAQPEQQESEVQQINEKLNELDEVRSLQFELTKDFKFNFGEAELIGKNDPFLKDLVQMLKEHPDYRLKIIGHTDNVGSPQANLTLSRDRAKAVEDHLVSNGVDAGQVTTVGMGDTQPVDEGYTEEAKAKNRRVEFIIYIDR